MNRNVQWSACGKDWFNILGRETLLELNSPPRELFFPRTRRVLELYDDSAAASRGDKGAAVHCLQLFIAK
jgi:hypothetical protein